MQKKNKNLYRRTLIALSAAIIFSAIFVFGANALVSVGLRPIKYILEIDPGQTHQDYITVTNNSQEIVSLKAALEDFIPVGEASINFVPRAGEGTSLVDWVSIDKNIFQLKPGEEKRIPFSITVPTKAVPGGHFAVLFFNTVSDKENENTVGISARIGSLMMVSVPGNISKGGSIDEFAGPKWLEKGPVSFSIKFHNSGSVHYKPEGKIILKNLFGKKIAEGIIDSQYVFPNTSRTFTGTVKTEKYFWGPVTAALEMQDGAGQPVTASTTFWGLPWRITILPVLGAILILFGLWQLKKRFRLKLEKR